MPFDHRNRISDATWAELAAELVGSQIEWEQGIGEEDALFTMQELASARAALTLPRLTDGALATLYRVALIEYELNLDCFYDDKDPGIGAYVNDIENLRDLLALEAERRDIELRPA